MCYRYPLCHHHQSTARPNQFYSPADFFVIESRVPIKTDSSPRYNCSYGVPPGRHPYCTTPKRGDSSSSLIYFFIRDTPEGNIMGVSGFIGWTQIGHIAVPPPTTNVERKGGDPPRQQSLIVLVHTLVTDRPPILLTLTQYKRQGPNERQGLDHHIYTLLSVYADAPHPRHVIPPFSL